MTRNTSLVRPRKQTPAMTARRPAEPFRPLPAKKLGVSLLSVKARRRRFSADLPPRALKSGMLATTELVTVIQNGVNGYVSTSVDELGHLSIARPLPAPAALGAEGGTFGELLAGSSYRPGVDILPATLGEHAGAIGAACLFENPREMSPPGAL